MEHGTLVRSSSQGRCGGQDLQAFLLDFPMGAAVSPESAVAATEQR
jgi:hypothetical protein